MAADQVLAYEVVTADGRFVTASNKVNSDLFWALRGGGGSSYGIVTSVIAKAYPRIKVTKSTFSFQAAPENSVNFWKGLNAFFKRFPTFTDAGTLLLFPYLELRHISRIFHGTVLCPPTTPLSHLTTSPSHSLTT